MGNRIILGYTVVILTLFGVYKVLSLPKQSTTPLATPSSSTSPSSSVTPGQPITARGEVVCLPSKNNTGIQTMGCAIGLKTDDGAYWGLNNIQTDLVNAKFGSGDIIEVTGTQNNAIINVTSTRVIKNGK